MPEPGFSREEIQGRPAAPTLGGTPPPAVGRIARMRLLAAG
ncbi:hypothetical protein [Streptomyces sp. NBC_00272]|nr:hypothetical protein [Streptomyces sp. NBC_00272]